MGGSCNRGQYALAEQEGGAQSNSRRVNSFNRKAKNIHRELATLRAAVLELTVHNPTLLPKDTYSLPILVYDNQYTNCYRKIQEFPVCSRILPATFCEFPLLCVGVPIIGIATWLIWEWTRFQLSGLMILVLLSALFASVWLMSPFLAFYGLAWGMCLLQAFSMRVLVDVTISWYNVQMADRSLKTRDFLLVFLGFSLGLMQFAIIVNLTQLSASILSSEHRAVDAILNFMQLQLLVRLDNTVVAGALFSIPPWVWEMAGFAIERPETESVIDDQETQGTIGSSDAEHLRADGSSDIVNFRVDTIAEKLRPAAQSPLFCYGFDQSCGRGCHCIVMSLPFVVAMLVLQEQATISFKEVDVTKGLGMCLNASTASGMSMVPIMDIDLCEGAARQIFHVDQVARGEEGDGPCLYKDSGRKLGKSSLKLSFNHHAATHQLCVPKYIRVPMISYIALSMNFAPDPWVSEYFPIVNVPRNGICAANDLDWIRSPAECERAQKLLYITPFNRSWWRARLYRKWLPDYNVAACLGFDDWQNFWNIVENRNDPWTPVVVCMPFQCTNVTARLSTSSTTAPASLRNNISQR